MQRISVGNSNTGFDSASVTKSKTGKYAVVPGTTIGRISVVRKAIAAVNRGGNCYRTTAGDYLPINVD
jgi:hypothetical protein